VRCEDVDLFFEIFDIVAQFLLFGGENDIAATEVAGASAKREMNVEGEFLCALFKVLEVAVISEAFIKLQCCGVARVAGSGFGIFTEFF